MAQNRHLNHLGKGLSLFSFLFATKTPPIMERDRGRWFESSMPDNGISSVGRAQSLFIFSFTNKKPKGDGNMKNLVNASKLFLRKNAPTILSTIGGVGVVATAVMAVKATPKALELIERAEEEKGEKLTKLEVVRKASVVYIPSVLVGAGTIACIFGANVLNKRQQAALMSAYALLDSSYKEYKAKTVELYGEDADNKVKDEIAKDKYEEATVQGDGEMLFYDSFSGQYFKSTLANVNNAEYQINRDLVMRDYAMVNEFYDYLGIPTIDGGDELGWSSGMNFDYYWQVWIDFMHRKVTMEDGIECTIITMYSEPCLGWEDYA